MHIAEQQNNIKIDIQTVGVKMNDYLERKIQNMIKRFRTLLPDINWVDIYLKTTEETANPRTVVVRFGLPGPDIVASDSGDRWKMMLKNVEKRLTRQLEKRKALLGKTIV